MNQLKTKSFSICLFFLILLTAPAYAQIVTWNPTGISNYGPSPWAPATTAANVTVGDIIRGAGISTTGGSPLANSWGGLNWTGAATEDVTFTLTPNPGYAVSISTLSLSYRRSSLGPATGTLEYTFGGSSTTYTVLAPLSFTNASTTGAITPVNLSAVADLQNVPAGTVIKFRLLPTGGLSVGTWFISSSAGMKLGGTVTSTSAFTSSITQTAPILCHGQAGATLSVTATGGTLPYTYSWSPTGGTSDVASGLTAGVYTCVVTSASSVTTMSTYTVTEPAALSSTLSTQSNVTCFNGSNGAATYTLNGGTPSYTYSWSPSGGNAAAATNLSAGNYTLSVTDANNCSLSSTVAISQPAAVTLTTTASSSVICNGSPVTVTASGANTYTWTNGITNGVAFSPSVTATYTVNGTNAAGCTGSAAITVTVNPLPLVSISASPSSTVCAGSPVTLSGNGANTYTWTGGVINGVAFTPTSSASYTVTGTTVNGCTNTAVGTITVNTLPVVNASISPSVAVCAGSPVTLTGNGANMYTWTGGVINGVAFTPTASASYTVTGTAANGCANTAVKTVTVNVLPALSATTSKATLCVGQTATLTASGAASYTWSTSQQTAVIAVSPTTTTIYTLSGASANGCTGTLLVLQNVSLCTGLEQVQASGPEIRFYPNPNNGSFTLESDRDVALSLVNSLGALVKTIALNDWNNHRLNIEGLSQGVYFLVSQADTHTLAQKIVVME